MGYVIYMVGGESYEEERFRKSDVTEKFYIEDDEWDVIVPKLNRPKSGVALCKFQNSFIYAFGGDNGSSKKNIVNEIERLDLAEEDNPEQKYWDLLYIKHKTLLPLAYAFASLIDDDRMILLGGRQNI